MTTTDETRTRSIPDILGWRTPPAEWGYAEGHWEHPTRGIVVDDRVGWDCDDMLQWLAERCEAVETWSNYVGEDLIHRVSVWDDGKRPVPEFTRPTLHAALEAACRAVADASDG